MSGGDTFILDLLYAMASTGGNRGGSPKSPQNGGYTFGRSSFHGHRQLNPDVQFMRKFEEFEKRFEGVKFTAFQAEDLFKFLDEQGFKFFDQQGETQQGFRSEGQRAAEMHILKPLLEQIIKHKQNPNQDVSVSDQKIVQDVIAHLEMLSKKYKDLMQKDFSTREVQEFYTAALKAAEPLAALNSPFYASYKDTIQKGIEDMKKEMDTNLATTAHGEAKEDSRRQRNLKIGATVAVTIGMLAFAACWALPPLGAGVTMGLLAVGAVATFGGGMVLSLTKMLGKSDAQHTASVATKAGIVPKDEPVGKTDILQTVTGLADRLKAINDKAVVSEQSSTKQKL